jgi:hypothetical protein
MMKPWTPFESGEIWHFDFWRVLKTSENIRFLWKYWSTKIMTPSESTHWELSNEWSRQLILKMFCWEIPHYSLTNRYVLKVQIVKISNFIADNIICEHHLKSVTCGWENIWRKVVLVRLLGTRFDARNCISEPGPQEPYSDFFKCPVDILAGFCSKVSSYFYLISVKFIMDGLQV